MCGNEWAVEGQVTEHVRIDEEAKVSVYLETVNLHQPWQHQVCRQIRADFLLIGAPVRWSEETSEDPRRWNAPLISLDVKKIAWRVCCAMYDI